MKVLVLNCGSSTVKFQLIDTDAELIAKNEDRFLAKGVVEKIGTTEALIRFQAGRTKPPSRLQRSSITNQPSKNASTCCVPAMRH